MSRKGPRLKRIVGICLVAVVSLAVVVPSVVSSPDGSDNETQKVIPATLIVGGKYSGQVKSQSPCVSGRTVVVRRTSDNLELGRGKTNASGNWSVPIASNAPVTISVLTRFIETDFAGDPNTPSGDPEDFTRCKGATRKGQANLAIEKSIKSANCQDGCEVTYTITVTNAGPDAASNVHVFDTFPATHTYVSDTGGCFPPQGNQITCNLGAVAVGPPVTFDISFDFDGCGGVNKVSVEAIGGPLDPDPSDNSDSADDVCAG